MNKILVDGKIQWMNLVTYEGHQLGHYENFFNLGKILSTHLVVSNCFEK